MREIIRESNLISIYITLPLQHYALLKVVPTIPTDDLRGSLQAYNERAAFLIRSAQTMRKMGTAKCFNFVMDEYKSVARSTL